VHDLVCNGCRSNPLDPLSESRIEKPHPVYVPRDETFEEIKQNTFSAGRLKALFHNLLPSLAATLSSSDIPFKCFSDIDKLYIEGVLLRDEESKGLVENLLVGKMMKQVLSAGESLLKYEIPAVIKGMLVQKMQHNLVFAENNIYFHLFIFLWFQGINFLGCGTMNLQDRP